MTSANEIYQTSQIRVAPKIIYDFIQLHTLKE